MLSLDPVPSIPHTIIELFGIAGSGNEAFPAPGTKIVLVSNVKTPVEETLYWVTGSPLKLKLNGMVSVLDHDGVDWFGPRITVQEGSSPLPKGYSLSLLRPPGFPGVCIKL